MWLFVALRVCCLVGWLFVCAIVVIVFVVYSLMVGWLCVCLVVVGGGCLGGCLVYGWIAAIGCIVAVNWLVGGLFGRLRVFALLRVAVGWLVFWLAVCLCECFLCWRWCLLVGWPVGRLLVRSLCMFVALCVCRLVGWLLACLNGAVVCCVVVVVIVVLFCVWLMCVRRVAWLLVGRSPFVCLVGVFFVVVGFSLLTGCALVCLIGVVPCFVGCVLLVWLVCMIVWMLCVCVHVSCCACVCDCCLAVYLTRHELDCSFVRALVCLFLCVGLLCWFVVFSVYGLVCWLCAWCICWLVVCCVGCVSVCSFACLRVCVCWIGVVFLSGG